MHLVASGIERLAGIREVGDGAARTCILTPAPGRQELEEGVVLVCGHGENAMSRPLGPQLQNNAFRQESGRFTVVSKAKQHNDIDL
jgi:hypothetical protein